MMFARVADAPSTVGIHRDAILTHIHSHHHANLSATIVQEALTHLVNQVTAAAAAASQPPAIMDATMALLTRFDRVLLSGGVSFAERHLRMVDTADVLLQ
jgi:hypothetical protein